MSFFSRIKSNSSTPNPAAVASPVKKDPNAPVPTPLEKHLSDAVGPVRSDGSDKFFGFENYGSTCYCNSIVQCLYYSAPFREKVINFPSKGFLESISGELEQNGSTNGTVVSPRNTSTTPYPNPASPARKVAPPTSPGPGTKPEESKDSPEYKKKMAIQNGPVLDMVYDNAGKYGMDESLFTALKDIFQAVIENKSRMGVVSPHKFLEILRRENEMFRSAMHQDAHEFLNLLLNQVVDNVEMFSNKHPEPLQQVQTNGSAPEEKGLAKSMSTAIAGANMPANGLDTHWVHDLFEGLLTSETRCLTCENTSQRDEAFLDLSVDLSAHTSVTSCLRKFSEEEMLCERNKFHCDNCGGLQEAEKRMKIKRLPRILALHLKRFKYTEDLQRLQKLFHRVVYPFYLRLFNTTEDAEDPDRLYELYAVVVHIGGGPYHGHYVSIIKTEDRGWLLFDDELVEPVDKNYVLNFFGGEPQPGVQDAKQLACAYVLFYQETTLEAMIKEQEAEANNHAEQRAARTSDAEAARESATSPAQKNPLQQMATVTTPIPEEMDHMQTLAHAQTAPVLSPGDNQQKQEHFSPPTVNPVMPPKSKKELKAEEKERKAAAKAAEKEMQAKRKESVNRRIEARKKADEDLKAAMAASEASAAEEARARGEEPPPTATTNANGKEDRMGGALSKTFSRHGSMSLRGRPKIFGGAKEKDEKEKLPPVPQSQQDGGDTSLGRVDTEGLLSGQERHVRTLSTNEDKGKRSSLFGLGRKKSNPML